MKIEPEVNTNSISAMSTSALNVCLCEHHKDGSTSPIPLNKIKQVLSNFMDIREKGPINVNIVYLDDNGEFVNLTKEDL